MRSLQPVLIVDRFPPLLDALLHVLRELPPAAWDQPTGPPAKVGAYHSMLSTYLNTVLKAGLTLEQVSEPHAHVGLATARPIWAEVPVVFVARCRKGAPTQRC